MFDADLDETDVAFLLDRFCSKAQRSGLKPFVTLASTIRKRRSGILAAVRFGINNDQVSHCTSSCCFGRWYGMCLVSCA